MQNESPDNGSSDLLPMIEVRNLSKVYETPGESVRVLEGLDLKLAAGEAVAIVGPSGSGKTTLLNLLGALDRPSGGSIRIDGKDISAYSPEEAGRFRNRSLGFIFQQHHLLPQLSVLENVLVPRLAGGWEETPAETEERARVLLGKVGLEHRLDHLPWQLSGGEKLRVAVARALINRPALVLADEPTGLLDQAASDKVADLLLQLNREEGVTLIVVTHNLSLARRIGRVFELANGQLKEVVG
jgi:lipoprotein-releasing system ATP-binding protein